MNVWAVATELAIWTLIVGSLAVFGWFLIEVVRIARVERERERARRSHRGTGGTEGG